MAHDEDGREIIEVRSLDDLEISKVTIKLELGEDFPVYYIPTRILSLSEWLACGREIERPSPPGMGSKNGTIYDYNEPGYLQRLADYNEKVMYRRLLRALLIEVPGATDSEKVASLEKRLGAGTTQTLYSILTQYHSIRMAQVETRARSFHNGGDLAPESDGPAGADSGEL